MPGFFKVTAEPVEPAGLARVEPFAELDPEALERLARLFVEIEAPAERIVAREGEAAEAFYVVRSGSLAVFRNSPGSPVQLLARLGPDDFFGELGLLSDGAYSVSVRSSEITRLLMIAREDLFAFLDDHPATLKKLQMTAARRHSAYVASVLELGRRREVRFPYHQKVLLKLDDGSSREVVLENLSVGGLCLAGAPEGWRKGQTVFFWLALREGELDLTGRVAWREGERIGIAFVKQSGNHDMILQMAIRLLLARMR